MNALVVRLNSKTSAFEAVVEGEVCEAAFIVENEEMLLHHTEVPKRLRGRGIADSLVGAAVAYARECGMKVRPVCSYAATWFKRHPEHVDVLAKR